MKRLLLALSVVLSLMVGDALIASHPVVTLDGVKPGSTPFISFVTLRLRSTSDLTMVSFSIRPKQGSQTRAIAATYSSGYLQRTGYYQPGSGKFTVPVFGLYQGRQNTVTVTSTFADGTTQPNRVNITTPAYDGGTFTSPTIVQARLRNTPLSYDFSLLKAYAVDDTPVIIDSDSEVRWVGSAGRGGQQSLLYNNGIYVPNGTSIVRLEFDGRKRTIADYGSAGITGFHHNFDYGRDGILTEVDLAGQPEATLMEVDANSGALLHTWNMLTIISNAMIAGGDNPADFILPGQDWFHNNAAAYRPSDDSLVVSSRENFVITLDYDTQAVKWILGDPTKHWHDFSSLRAFALTLGADTLPPIGQHAVSIVKDQLLLMDDGQQSTIEMPLGEERTYSAPRKYSITNTTATEVFHYFNAPSIFSPFCSSAYEDTTDNYLFDYTIAGPFISDDILALDSNGNVAFYYRYALIDGACGTAFYANPIHLENLLFQ